MKIMEWIKFKDRTPKVKENIICAWNGKEIFDDAWFDYEKQEWVNAEYDDFGDFDRWIFMKPQATHYILCPEPPKEN